MSLEGMRWYDWIATGCLLAAVVFPLLPKSWIPWDATLVKIIYLGTAAIMGLYIAVRSLRGWERKEPMTGKKPPSTPFPVPCPLCGNRKGLRLTNDSGLRLICISCEELDENIEMGQVVECLTGLVQYSSDNNGISHELLTDIVHEKFNLPEEEEEE